MANGLTPELYFHHQYLFVCHQGNRIDVSCLLKKDLPASGCDFFANNQILSRPSSCGPEVFCFIPPVPSCQNCPVFINRQPQS